MSSRLIAICDLCGTEQVIKAAAGCDWERELEMEGWWPRDDGLGDLCPKHPQPVGDLS